MRRFRTSIAAALSILLLTSIVFAQQSPSTAVPNLIRYGGTLKDANGGAIAATTGVTFAIYQQQDGGAPVWMETQNVTPDAGGNYSVLLGSTTTTGLPSDLFSQEEQRWLAVQVQGQAEQPRVLLVSVPYALKAHEAETLAGKSISDFVLAKDVNGTSSAAGVASISGSASTQATAGNGNNNSPSKLAATAGPTNFSGSTTDQIVGVVQSGTGKAIVASSSTGNAIVASTSNTTTSTNAVSGTIPGPGVAILGHASSTSAQAYGIQGTSDSTIGIGLLGFATATTGSTYGLKGYSSSTGGTGVRGLSTATTGVTTGISASVASPAGTAGVFNNVAGGKILSGQNNGTEKFSVDGGGNLNAKGNYVGLGSISGHQLISTVATGTAPFLVTSTTQVPNLNASTLAGNPPSSFAASTGSPNYIQNGTALQSSANFNISGKGTLGGSLSAANAVTGGAAVTGNDTAATSSGGSSGIAGYLRNDVNGTAVYGENDVATGGIAIFGYDAATASAATAALYGVSANGFGVLGLANAATGGADGVRGRTNSNGGVGVRGINTADGGTGIFGVARSTSSTIAAYGISGLTDASGQNSAGVTGFANATTGLIYGVTGSTNSTTQYAAGVNGYEGAASGVVFGVNGGTSSNTNGAAGVSGNAGATTGQVYGVFGSTNSITTSAAGVSGYEGATTGQVFGVAGSTNSTTNYAAGVSGYEGATSGLVFGVNGSTNSISPGAAGISGYEGATSGQNFGVIGGTASSDGVGVAGYASATSGANFGVQGSTASSQGVGVAGWSPGGVGVAGINQTCSGMVCTPTTGTAGQFTTAAGGTLLQGIGGGATVFTVDSSGNGFYAGNLHVTGTLTKGGGSFKIDHPLDPENKYLSHSFVESPDMMNIYNGTARLNARGEVWITMPDYFDALNRDFRYVLTALGRPQPYLYIARKMNGNRFKIAGGKPNAEVSWQVTGIRQDAWANAHRIPVEEDKSGTERGTYLHPELFGASAEASLNARLQH